MEDLTSISRSLREILNSSSAYIWLACHHNCSLFSHNSSWTGTSDWNRPEIPRIGWYGNQEGSMRGDPWAFGRGRWRGSNAETCEPYIIFGGSIAHCSCPFNRHSYWKIVPLLTYHSSFLCQARPLGQYTVWFSSFRCTQDPGKYLWRYQRRCNMWLIGRRDFL